jgi:hypothetical protein
MWLTFTVLLVVVVYTGAFVIGFRAGREVGFDEGWNERSAHRYPSFAQTELELDF